MSGIVLVSCGRRIARDLEIDAQGSHHREQRRREVIGLYGDVTLLDRKIERHSLDAWESPCRAQMLVVLPEKGLGGGDLLGKIRKFRVAHPDVDVRILVETTLGARAQPRLAAAVNARWDQRNCAQKRIHV